MQPDNARTAATLGALAAIDTASVENVLPALLRWRQQGRRAVLVTLVAIDGSSPRRIGAQMAVAADGDTLGSLSGGCLEAAIVAEAKSVLATGQNRVVRYGKGSRYIDIRLPCGSGLDLYFDQALDDRVLAEAVAYQQRRVPFMLRTLLNDGRTELIATLAKRDRPCSGMQTDDLFVRCYQPVPRLLIAGIEPMAGRLTALATALGMSVQRVDLTDGAAIRPEDTDHWTAAVLLFHEHEKELALLHALLQTHCFFIGAMGSRRAHQARLDSLAARGVSRKDLARIQGPIGLIGGAKTPNELAISILAQVMDRAMRSGMTL